MSNKFTKGTWNTLMEIPEPGEQIFPCVRWSTNKRRKRRNAKGTKKERRKVQKAQKRAKGQKTKKQEGKKQMGQRWKEVKMFPCEEQTKREKM